MLSRRPGAVKHLLLRLDGFACQKCRLDLERFPDLLQRHHMIDRETINAHRTEGVMKLLAGLRRDIGYQISLCPACHAEVHRTRDAEFFFPNCNVNSIGVNIRKLMAGRMVVMTNR